MVETAAKPRVTGLIPLAPVADVQRSIDFYRLLGLELRASVKNDDGSLQWAHLACELAELMFSRALEPAITSPTMTFYLYSPDLVALRESLLAAGVIVSSITYPLYMTKGEVCLTDPDGYTLLIGQAG